MDNISPSIEQIRPEHTWQLRRDVLYPGKMKHEMEMDEDADGIHFGAFVDDRLAGVVSLFQNGSEFQFRKLAVDASMQKKGIGQSLLAQVVKHVEENGGGRLWCNARVDATGFYLKLGFIRTGNLFTKNDIDYEIMEKMITPPLDQPA
ncbi:GNAT family N-acetyltransferase [Mucilaginibacter sp. BJC16-A38]|uniref:GNAT family N-acetyltransferase n=1 Tax=Mucilaginibacter phenanthrenivorans TaxID=1234842 RepID=UPI0021572D83|nr:GNAT family N-acetyltransferase [Mucilaginibacter phenanthrenivorans]MCR8561756.1 GNAT family N-acetyltransferase [Mucilaginibacter phenanthrenivorans]